MREPANIAPAMACGRCNSIEVRCDKTLAAARSHKNGDTQDGAFRAVFWIILRVVIGYPCVASLSRAARIQLLFGYSIMLFIQFWLAIRPT
jgi:hypothetical protein